MPECPCCKAPCEEAVVPNHSVQWFDPVDGKVRSEFYLNSVECVYAHTRRKATVDEYISYQELKNHLEQLEGEYRNKYYGGGRNTYIGQSEKLRIKTSVEQTLKLLEEFIDFSR